jgi:hypothetical protein
VNPRYLPEIPEAEAEGSVAETYEDIRRVVGFPLVNLVYRTLAVVPGRLEEIWRDLRPNLAGAAAEAGARELLATAAPRDRVVPLSRSALAAAGVEGDELRRVASTLEAYEHANPRNLLAVTALLHGVGGRGAQPEGGSDADQHDTALLPMADLSTLARPARELLEEMAAAIAAGGETVLVPSLFRHFAHNPCLLALIWTALRPLVDGGSIRACSEAVSARAASLATALPYPVGRLEDEETRAVLERFATTIPRMLVAGSRLRRSLEKVL